MPCSYDSNLKGIGANFCIRFATDHRADLRRYKFKDCENYSSERKIKSWLKYPPEVGDVTATDSPAFTRTWSQGANSSRGHPFGEPQCARLPRSRHQLNQQAVECDDEELRQHPRKRKARRVPSPPRYCPAPPELLRTENSSTTTGKRSQEPQDQHAGIGRMVCTAWAPAKPAPLFIPPLPEPQKYSFLVLQCVP